MKKIIFLLILLNSLSFFSQNKKAPVYNTCQNVNLDELENCFLENLKSDFLKNFKTPKEVTDKQFKGKIIILFSISTEGKYTVNYINSNFSSVTTEAKKIFDNLPSVEPAMYNGHKVESEYILPFYLPLSDNFMVETQIKEEEKEVVSSKIKIQKEAITTVKINADLNQFPELNSSLTIPFTHQQYNLINNYGNALNNEHSAVKPYFYNETAAYKKVATDKTKLFKNAKTALGKKTWNDNLIYLKGKDYWFTINPIFDSQIGKDNSDISYTYNNTRAVNVRGSIGKLSFSTSIFESQGRFAKYINDYSRTLKPANSHAVFLGAGNSKAFKDGGFDYPVAEGYISYNANKHFNLQFGNGKNFIGDGYRSLFLSDAAAPYTFAKISTNFWKVKYTNLWMWINDVRSESFTNDAYLRKFVAMHHLSINLTKKWNIGLFESTITNARSNPNIDINFVNPIIFYRSVEYARGSKSGNAIIGLNTKYKFKNANIYGQFVLDELIVSKIFKEQGSRVNKYGFQLGFHYYNAFKVKNLTIQGETNIVRPYIYAHNNSELNYTHYYQPLAHAWGSNFVEFIGIVRYNKKRLFGNLKVISGKKGFDFESDAINYGGNLFESYSNGLTENNTYYQGNTATILIADLQLGYIINPTTNLQIFANASMRHFKIKEALPYFTKENTTWFSFGLKADVFNSYFDF